MPQRQSLLLNLRFFVLAAAVIVSLIMAAWLRLQIVNDQLYVIRIEQVFGLIAVMLIYTAIVITPLSRFLKTVSWFKQFLFVRRAIGVAAAYYAVLHTLIALQGQLGGLSGIDGLPPRFQLSLSLALAALVVLGAMAATSTDWAIRRLTFRRWKQLHRFIYLAGILIIVHVWLIGTHVTYAPVRQATYIALGFLIIIEALRFGQNMRRRFEFGVRLQVLAVMVPCLIGLFGLLALPKLLMHDTMAPATHLDHDAGMQMDMKMEMSH